MFVFAASDKGGTGRSVTSSNILYRSALQGNDVCYVDFDFGSPTSGAIFGIERAENGTTRGGGLHQYFLGETARPERIDIWAETERPSVRNRVPGAGRLILLPGDNGGSDFTSAGSREASRYNLCRDLILRLNEEFALVLVDLSAGRNWAVDMVLTATAMPELRNLSSRWLVFHRWTKQHVVAAGGLVNGARGLVESAVKAGHDRESFADNLRYVRTAVIDATSANRRSLTAKQGVWLTECDKRLQTLAGRRQVGRNLLLGAVPLDPMLQWQEQLITDDDVGNGIANQETRNAFDSLAKRIVDDTAWETL